MPTCPSAAGYEFSESINGVVSVRKVRRGAPEIPDTDLAMVRADLARHEHFRGHRVESRGSEIIVYEPTGGISSNAIAHLASVMYLSPKAVEARLGVAGALYLRTLRGMTCWLGLYIVLQKLG